MRTLQSPCIDQTGPAGAGGARHVTWGRQLHTSPCSANSGNLVNLQIPMQGWSLGLCISKASQEMLALLRRGTHCVREEHSVPKLTPFILSDPQDLAYPPRAHIGWSCPPLSSGCSACLCPRSVHVTVTKMQTPIPLSQENREHRNHKLFI